MNDLTFSISEDWQDMADALANHCFGYLHGAPSCSVSLAFCGGVAEALAAGGGFLIAFLLGSVVCYSCHRALQIAGICLFFVVAAAASLATTALAERELPELDE